MILNPKVVACMIRNERDIVSDMSYVFVVAIYLSEEKYIKEKRKEVTNMVFNV